METHHYRVKHPASPLVAALAFTLALCGCEKKVATPPPPAKSAAAQTFDATAAHLDTGGDFYLYLRTEEVFGNIASEMDEWKESILQMAGPDLPMPREEIDKWYALARKTVIDTGIVNLRAFGMSGIEIEPGLNRMKSMIYCGDVADRGLLWNLGGHPAPHPIAALDFLPDTTAYAAFMDFDPLVLWNFIQRTLNDIPDPDLQKQAAMGPAVAQIWFGMTPKELFESLDAEVGLVVTTDQTETMEVPFQQAIVKLPRAAGALLIRVKDDKLYNLIVAKLEETIGRMMPVTKTGKEGVRLATIQTPTAGSPIPLEPVVARFGDYVAIATAPALVMQLARKGDHLPGLLRDAPAFQRFAKLEKLEANSFGYLSERGSSLIRTLQLSPLEDNPQVPAAMRPRIEQLYSFFSQKYMFSLGRVEKDGLSSTIYSPNGSKQLVATAMLLPAALVAIAVPNIDLAMKTARSTQSLQELREIEQAMKLLEADRNVPAGTVIAPADLESYIPPNTPLGRRLRAEPFVDLLGNPYPELQAGSPPHVPAATAATYQKQTNRGFWGAYAPVR